LENVGLELHQHRVGGSAAIDFENRKLKASFFFHRVDDVFRLVSDRIKSGSGDVMPVGAPGQAEDRSPGIIIPIGRA
jgi:hypothetical protein